ncbi:MAG: GMC family oxidoreductase [Halioglobus sp.]|nr:GMC family oxidoreductase [Halioglobus sp.]
MIVDGRERDGATFEGDVCVVGAGAAGLTLAVNLARRGVRVVLVESGGLKFDPQTQALLEVELSGSTHEGLFQRARARYFGGTTNLWGGVCLPLDPFEFEQHSWVPYSGWPITRADLQPYYEAAAVQLGLKGVDSRYEPGALGVAEHPRLIAAAESAVATTFPPRVPARRLRMGRWRREEVSAHPLIQCVLNTTIVELRAAAAGDSVTSLEGRTLAGGTLHFRARDYVLCTGAVENARLLLASDSVTPGGLGNGTDQVGRYFMIHPPNGGGRILPLRPGVGRTQEEVLSDKYNVGWAVTPEARREHELQGFHAFLFSNDLADPLPFELAVRRLTRTGAGPRADAAAVQRRGVLINWEQAPNPRSRVTLASTRDKLGMRKAHVHLDVTAEDLSRAQRSIELIGAAMARTGFARLFFSDIANTPILGGGGHQMGTTRMSREPADGVTDIHGRVHSVDNLFVSGSSLFPTGGWQNPTFTIIALALRQAEHLHARTLDA